MLTSALRISYQQPMSIVSCGYAAPTIASQLKMKSCDPSVSMSCHRYKTSTNHHCHEGAFNNRLQSKTNKENFSPNSLLKKDGLQLSEIKHGSGKNLINRQAVCQDTSVGNLWNDQLHSCRRLKPKEKQNCHINLKEMHSKPIQKRTMEKTVQGQVVKRTNTSVQTVLSFKEMVEDEQQRWHIEVKRAEDERKETSVADVSICLNLDQCQNSSELKESETEQKFIYNYIETMTWNLENIMNSELLNLSCSGMKEVAKFDVDEQSQREPETGWTDSAEKKHPNEDSLSQTQTLSAGVVSSLDDTLPMHTKLNGVGEMTETDEEEQKVKDEEKFANLKNRSEMEKIVILGRDTGMEKLVKLTKEAVMETSKSLATLVPDDKQDRDLKRFVKAEFDDQSVSKVCMRKTEAWKNREKSSFLKDDLNKTGASESSWKVESDKFDVQVPVQGAVISEVKKKSIKKTKTANLRIHPRLAKNFNGLIDTEEFEFHATVAVRGGSSACHSTTVDVVCLDVGSVQQPVAPLCTLISDSISA